LIYFDHNASTPVRPEAREAMNEALGGPGANPSSAHREGQLARAAIERAREQVASLVGAAPADVTFVSGGTEGDHAAVIGMALALEKRGRAVAISAIEHHAVHGAGEVLARLGFRVTHLPVDARGFIDPASVPAAGSGHTLVAVMLANNETGVIQDVAAVAALARSARAWMHTDAVQALGKIPVDFQALGVHAMTISAHKLYGPKGAAALVVDKRLQLRPIIHGGGHEQGLRSGTENVPAIVGFGAACDVAAGRMQELARRQEAMRARLEKGLYEMGATIFGEDALRIPNTSYFAFKGIVGETLVIELDKEGYAVAPGAACSSANPEPSATLLAMGVDPEFARGAVRFSLGAGNTLPQIDEFLKALKSVVTRLKSLTAMVA